MRTHTQPVELQTAPSGEDFEAIYREERHALLVARLRPLLVHAGIPVWFAFALLDVFVSPPEQLAKLLILRCAIGTFALLALAWTHTELGRRMILLVSFACGYAGGFGISIMSAILGGFSSQYYVGLLLIIAAMGLFIPWSMRSYLIHTVPQLAFYFAVNALVAGLTRDAVLPFFFLGGTALMEVLATQYAEATRRQDLRQRLEINEATERLKQLDQAKNRFFANLSHELRTPLTLIIGSLRSVLQGAPDSRSTATAGLRNAAHLLGLVNDLLDLAKLEKTESVHKQPTDVAALTRQITASFSLSGSAHGIELSGAEEPLSAEVDPKLYTKVIYNLLSNALKFSRAQGRCIRVRMTRDHDSFSVSVEDNGVGIPKDKLDSIFERFAQVEESSVRTVEGTGIGLALVKEAATAHGGTVSVQSELERGTTFTVRLPVGGVQTGQTSAAEHAVAEEFAAGVLQIQKLAREAGKLERQTPLGVLIDEAAPKNAPLVLVAEDHRDLRAYLRRVLEQHFRLIIVEDGLAALHQLEATPVDLVLTDQMMPKLDGQQLLEAVRHNEQLHALPVVILTADVAAKSRLEALHAGADDYVAKPFDERELVVRMENLIRAHVQERELEHANVVLKEMALLDGLTQVANRRCLDQALADSWKAMQQQGAPMAVLLCDIDHFKPFNDLYGHQAGDQCIKQVAQALHGTAQRKGDLVARYGGEEFAVLLPNSDLVAATAVANRVLTAVRSQGVEHAASPVADVVTISIGVASAKAPMETDRPELLLKHADEALYRAKYEGRNRLACADESSEQPETGTPQTGQLPSMRRERLLRAGAARRVRRPSALGPTGCPGAPDDHAD